MIVDRILSSDPIVKVIYEGKPEGKFKEDAVLMLSDTHIGKKNIWLDPEKGQNIITYDTDIVIKKAARLIDCVYTINDILEASYTIETLHIFMLGDILDNHIIYRGQEFFVDADVGKQVWIAVKIFVDIFKALLAKFPKVEVVGIPGNHSRMTDRNDECFTSSTFDYQLLKILEVYFRDEPRIKFTVPDSWYYLVKIKKWRYLLHHGSSVYSWMSLPYYGIVRQSKSRRTEIEYDAEIIGHFHQRMEVPTSSKTYTLVNGSWISKDSYAWKKFGVLSKAEQYMFGVSEKRPISWSFIIDLEKY